MDKRIKNLISQMTLKEKIGQLTQEWTSNNRMDELCELAEKGEVGSCILTDTPWAGNSKQEDLFLDKLNEIQRCAVEKSRLGIPVINGRDVIHGSKTIFPIPLAQAASWDYDLIRDAAYIMSKEASEDGVHWTFAPMLDICTEPRWGRIIESPGEDVLIGKMFAKASVDGIQSAGISSCAKHYIGYGASAGGRDKDPCEWSDYSLRNRALPAFDSAIKAGVHTVMSSFNEVGGQPVTSSRYYLTDILRDELGFEGFVVSDWGAVERLKCQGVSDDNEISAILAINAGVDMDMVDGIYKNNLEKLVEDGKVGIETVDRAVERILKIKFELGLFENPYFDTSDNSDKVMKKEYLDKAKELSLHSVVLLKNSGVLPLKKGTPLTLLGPFAEEKEALLGSWCAGGRAKDVVSLADGMQSINGKDNVFVSQGTGDIIYRNAERTDIYVIALGENAFMTGEGNSVSKIELPEEQVRCAKNAKEKGKTVIAVIFAGRPRALTEIMPYCDAVLWAWHGGTMCGQAIAEIIFGDFNPCGKLPVTLPRATGQIPIFYNHNPNECNANGYYEEKLNYRDVLSTPLFEFGYGLSYTDFRYSDFEYNINKERNCVEISFKVENVGEYDGYEIAECYVNDIVASMSRPIKELKAFEKVFIKKGETKDIMISLNKEDLSFWNNKGEMVFESGKFKIEIGKSCKNIVFKTIEEIQF